MVSSRICTICAMYKDPIEFRKSPSKYQINQCKKCVNLRDKETNPNYSNKVSIQNKKLKELTARRCNVCLFLQHEDNFYLRKGKLDKKCIDCRDNQILNKKISTRLRSVAYKSTLKAKEVRYVTMVLQKYKLQRTDIINLLKTQNYKCQICERNFYYRLKNFAVDHCHKSGKVRGLLCMGCNTSLGQLKEDINIINRMKNYILTHNTLNGEVSWI